MLTKKNIERLFFIGLIIVLYIYLRGCGNTVINPGGEPIVVSDTIVKTNIDTLEFNSTDTVTVYSTVFKTDTVWVNDTSLLAHTTEVNDSLIEGKIVTTVKKNGALVDQSLSYIPKFPKYIKQTDSVIITNDIYHEEADWGIYLGGSLLIQPNAADIFPCIGLKTKGDIYINAGYGVISKSYWLGAQFNIIRKRK